MEKVQLKTLAREMTHRNAKHLYREGLIPGNLYGNNISNVHVGLNQIEFEKVLRKAGESTIIELMMPDGGMRNVLIQRVDRHYLTSKPIHVDFYEVSMTEKLTATVQLEFFGEAPAIKVLGGTLVKALSEVEVECLPGDLPHQIDVDISVLNTFDDQITVADLKVSDKVEIKAEPEEMVAKVQEPRDVEAELAPEVDEAAAVAAAVGPEAAGEEAAESADEKK
jgi:large subunit ribosomal protein L25